MLLSPGIPNSSHFNVLARETQQARRVTPTPGSAMFGFSFGRVIAPVAQDYGVNNPKALMETQGMQDTDTWELGIDAGKGCAVDLLSDLYVSGGHLCYRTRRHTYDSNGRLLKVEGEAAARQVADINMSDISVVTDAYIDSGALKKKTRMVSVLNYGTETASTIISPTSVNVVTDVVWSSPNLTHNSINILAWSTNTPTSGNAILTGGNCP
jgi:hypothetical protein